jgi:iron complex outermembrane receptor protein
MVLSLLATAGALRAQGGSATIQGRISDTQQLAIARVVAELQDAQGRTVESMVADGAGYYTFPMVQPGSYTLRFSRSGFEIESRPVTVTTGQTVVLDVILRPQEVIQSLTVEAAIDDDRLVGSKTDIPLIETPVTVQTVPLEVILRQDARDLVAVLGNIPSTNTWTQYGVYNHFVFRGFEMAKDPPGSAVLLNGLRLEGNRINQSVNSIESVQVLKGPASMLYGTEAAGGTISIVQKRPVATPLYEVAVRGGRWGVGSIEFGATGPLGSERLLYRIDTAYEHSEGFRKAGYDRFNVTPALYWRIGPSDQLDVRITHNQGRYDLDAGIPLVNDNIPDIPLDRRFNTPGNFERASMPVFQTFYEHSFSEMVRVRQAFQYQYIGDEYWHSEGLTVDSSTPTQVDREYLYFNRFENSLVTQTDLLADFDLFWRHRTLIGYEYDWYSPTIKRSASASGTPIPPIDLFNPVETATAVTSFPASRYDTGRNRSHGFYFQDYVRLHPRIQFMFSGRYDSFSQRTQRGAAAPVIEFEQKPFTYRVALNTQVLPELSFYTSYGTTFEAQRVLSPTGDTLEPQSGWQYEVGGRLNFFQNRFTLDTSVYRLVQDNIVVFRAIDVFDQGGRKSSSGAEIEIRGRASQRLSVFASYGFTQARIDELILDDGDTVLTGNVPGFVPRHTARLWGTYEFPGGVGVSLGGRYLGKHATDEFNTLFLGGYTVWDAGFFYRRRAVEYSVNIKNIFNKTRYFVSPILFNEQQLTPGPGVDATATVRFRFQ